VTSGIIVPSGARHKRGQAEQRMRVILIALTVSAAVVVAAAAVASVTDEDPYRAYSESSYWNRPLPANAPIHPDSAEILEFLREDNVDDGCVLLAGAQRDPWGMPIYWATENDQEYDVVETGPDLPPEFDSLRIPTGAVPSKSPDGEMVVYDLDAGYVAWLHEAQYEASRGRWSAAGGSIAYLDSNGLENRVEGGDPRNSGTQRGLNGAVVAARWDEVRAGAIEHVLRVGVNTARSDHIWPMSGSDGTSEDRYAPPQGGRIRIKPSVDLERYDLAPHAVVIARALQQYGAIVGDSTGAPLELKLEDTTSEGRGQLWTLDRRALCAIPIEDFDVIDYGHDYR
jgi:hypothetical protein